MNDDDNFNYPLPALPATECANCGEELDDTNTSEGFLDLCEDCESIHQFCSECGTSFFDNSSLGYCSPCGHLVWSDKFGSWVGCGDDDFQNNSKKNIYKESLYNYLYLFRRYSFMPELIRQLTETLVETYDDKKPNIAIDDDYTFQLDDIDYNPVRNPEKTTDIEIDLGAKLIQSLEYGASDETLKTILQWLLQYDPKRECEDEYSTNWTLLESIQYLKIPSDTLLIDRYVNPDEQWIPIADTEGGYRFALSTQILNAEIPKTKTINGQKYRIRRLGYNIWELLLRKDGQLAKSYNLADIYLSAIKHGD